MPGTPTRPPGFASSPSSTDALDDRAPAAGLPCRPRRRRSTPFIEVLREPAAIAHRFVELEAAAVREILFFTEPPYAIDPEQNVQGLRLLERRIEARSAYERSLYDHPAQAEWGESFRAFVATGEQARRAAAQTRRDRRARRPCSRSRIPFPARTADDHDRRKPRVRLAAQARLRGHVGLGRTV